MNALVLVYLLNPVASTGRCEVPELGVNVGEIFIFGQLHLLFFDSTDDPFRIGVLGRLTDFGIADLHAVVGEQTDIGRGGAQSRTVTQS